MTPGAIINPKNLSTLAVYGLNVPCEGPMVLPILALSFAQTERYFIDFSNEMRIGRISMIQSVWIDASNLGNGPGPIMVLSNVGQRILLNPKKQGTFPFLCQQPFSVVIECHAGGQADIIFSNFMLPAANWDSQPI